MHFFLDFDAHFYFLNLFFRERERKGWVGGEKERNRETSVLLLHSFS